MLNAVARHVPWLVGGAADLAPSTDDGLDVRGAPATSRAENPAAATSTSGSASTPWARRERAVALQAAPYGSTYLIFSDYAREPIRLSALMEIPAIWIFTHDSIGLGEDGPTHQPVEQLASLRAIPGLVTIRPCRRQRGGRRPGAC